MVEEKVKFQSSFSIGESSMDTFLDSTNPLNRIAHPALPKVIKDQLEINQKRGELKGGVVSNKQAKLTSMPKISRILIFLSSPRYFYFSFSYINLSICMLLSLK